MHKDWRPPQAEFWNPGAGNRAWRGFGRRMACGGMLIFLVFLATVGFGAVVLVNAIAGATNLGPSASIAILVIVGLLLMRTAGRMFRPVRDLVRAAGDLADGDYTARVRPARSRAMGRVVSSFNEMARRLEESDEQRRRLLADLGHELRTPLTVIRGEVEAISDGVHQADEATLEQLLDEVVVMERLIEDLRTLSLAEAGALALYPEPTDLAALIVDVADGQRIAAREAGVDITLDPDDTVGEVVVDPVRLKEVVTNLTVNALRAMPGGGSLTISTQNNGDHAVIEVSDSGVGIDSGDLETVFERFQKGSGSTGSGLGLTISKDLVEAHGGSMFIASEPGAGTTVTVALPMIRDKE